MKTAQELFTVVEAAQCESPSHFLRSRDYMRALFSLLKEKRESYSYRQFARDLGFGFTNYMHLILTGQRPLSDKAAERIGEALRLRGDERRYFQLLVASENAKSPNAREPLFAELIALKHRMLPPDLDRDMLDYLTEWYHPVIREMAALPEFEAAPAWICERIFPRISEDEAAASLTLLQRIGFLVPDPENPARLVQRDVNVRTGSLVRNLSARRYHQAMMELAREALTKVPAAEREFQALTVPASPELVLEIKDEIGRFWRWLLERSAACESPDRVLQVNIQAFPATRREKKS